MYRTIIALSIILITGLASFGQSSDEYNKNEFYVGGVFERIDFGAERQNGFGGEVSYVRNIHRYFGFKADFSIAGGGSNSYTFTGNNPVLVGTGGSPYTVRIKQETTLSNVLGGVQFKDNSKATKIKPFAHMLAGVTYTRNTISSSCISGSCPGPLLSALGRTENNFGLAAGAGLDIRANDRIDIRVIQVDYNPSANFDFVQHNLRFGAGIVFKF